MKKMVKIMTMVVALATILVFGSGVMAAQSMAISKTSSMATSPAKIEKFKGVVESVDQTAQSFIVNKGKKDMTFYWDDHTKITAGKMILSPMDIRKGEHLTVAYREEGGKATAQKINVSIKMAHKKSESKTY